MIFILVFIYILTIYFKDDSISVLNKYFKTILLNFFMIYSLLLSYHVKK